mmetsp:Transcript_13323/g.42448  ORF Transcript_13323/g.42448 Transcript_13323/m.42448 type:complete len:632 (-) Transcript_13323:13-1908(-)
MGDSDLGLLRGPWREAHGQVRMTSLVSHVLWKLFHDARALAVWKHVKVLPVEAHAVKFNFKLVVVDEHKLRHILATAPADDDKSNIHHREFENNPAVFSRAALDPSAVVEVVALVGLGTVEDALKFGYFVAAAPGVSPLCPLLRLATVRVEIVIGVGDACAMPAIGRLLQVETSWCGLHRAVLWVANDRSWKRAREHGRILAGPFVQERAAGASRLLDAIERLQEEAGVHICEGVGDDLKAERSRVPVAEDDAERLAALLVGLVLAVPCSRMVAVTDRAPLLAAVLSSLEKGGLEAHSVEGPVRVFLRDRAAFGAGIAVGLGPPRVEEVHWRAIGQHLSPAHELFMLLDAFLAVLKVRPAVVHDIRPWGNVLRDAENLVFVRVATTAAFACVLHLELEAGSLPNRAPQARELLFVAVVVAIVVASSHRASNRADNELFPRWVKQGTGKEVDHALGSPGEVASGGVRRPASSEKLGRGVVFLEQGTQGLRLGSRGRELLWREAWSCGLARLTCPCHRAGTGCGRAGLRHGRWARSRGRGRSSGRGPLGGKSRGSLLLAHQHAEQEHDDHEQRANDAVAAADASRAEAAAVVMATPTAHGHALVVRAIVHVLRRHAHRLHAAAAPAGSSTRPS